MKTYRVHVSWIQAASRNKQEGAQKNLHRTLKVKAARSISFDEMLKQDGGKTCTHTDKAACPN